VPSWCKRGVPATHLGAYSVRRRVIEVQDEQRGVTLATRSPHLAHGAPEVLLVLLERRAARVIVLIHPVVYPAALPPTLTALILV
jgi:hypothetical protein